MSSSHLRLNLLTGEWVLVGPQRGARPHSEEATPPSETPDPPYDPTCYLCVGNMRKSGIRNPDYTGVYAFDNDFPALSRGSEGAPSPPSSSSLGAVLQMRPERGICRVLCYSPRHDLPPARLPRAAMRLAIDAWVEEYRTLGAIPWINHVQIFENHGALGGASSRHPHSQIWAEETVPHDPAVEAEHQAAYAREHDGACLLCDVLKHELAGGARLVCENDGFAVIVPYWAVWPFETLVLAKRHYSSIETMTDTERDLFADIIQQITARYDALFHASFPYAMAMHQAPTDRDPHPEWHFHAHYFSPMRAAGVEKVMAGYELAAGPERDDLPEDAAAMLRAAGK
ncbi:MAG TPA: galactose-1-phosphate uridylyltransferase [Rhizomicrobium sp.]|jgi:UDPglucose--hexose-1-phosphate uridylyltransferase